MLVIITVFSFWYQQRWGTVADTSWLITVNERMLGGERLYVDLLETNPPFSVWLYTMPVWVAQQLGLAPELLVQAWTYVAALAGLLFAGFIVRRAGFPEAAALTALAPLAYAVLVLLPGNAFSQREHIGVALFLPLLVLLAWRAGGRLTTGPSVALAILAGLSGSVIVLVKPYYALMVLVPALVVVARQRSLRPFFAPEFLTIGAVCLAYLALVWTLHPEFVTEIYPMVAEGYVQVRFLPKIIATFALPYAAVMVLAWWLARERGASDLATVAMLASLAGVVCLVQQGKGFAYHGYPALACGLLAVICLLALPAPGGRLRQVLVLAAACVAAVLAASPFRPAWKPDANLLDTVKAAVRQPTMAQIGSDLAIGHPFVRLAGGRWVSAYPSDWRGSAAFILAETGTGGARQLEIAENYVAAKRAELLRMRPDIILVQKNDIIWQPVIADPDGLAPVLQDYRPLAENRVMRVLLRNDITP